MHLKYSCSKADQSVYPENNQSIKLTAMYSQSMV